MKKTSEILAYARDLVEKGWLQGDLEDELGNVCAVGAISRAETWAGRASLCHLKVYPYAALLDQVREQTSQPHLLSVPDWNDDPSTTKQDVLNAFDKAINGLEEQGL